MLQLKTFVSHQFLASLTLAFRTLISIITFLTQRLKILKNSCPLSLVCIYLFFWSETKKIILIKEQIQKRKKRQKKEKKNQGKDETCLYLSPFIPDARAWSLSSWGLFLVKLFFLVLSNQFNLIPFYPSKFVWKSKFPSKLKTFSWLMAHNKVHTNDMLQLRKSYKALSSNVVYCVWRVEKWWIIFSYFVHWLWGYGI